MLLQHLRIRPGSSTCNSALIIWSGDHHNVVLDHLSVTWSQDEQLYIGQNQPDPTTSAVTIWRSLMAEGLYFAPGSGSCTGGGSGPGHGLLIDNDTKNVAVLQSLFASNGIRNPYGKGGSTTYVANNMMYNFGDGTYELDPESAGSSDMAVIGNYYKRGPNTPTPALMTASRYLQTGSRLYLSDNTRDGASITEFAIIGPDGIDPRVGTAPITAPGYVPMTSSAVPAFILPKVGARPADRDAVDTRIVAYVSTGGGSWPSQPSDVGGYPSLSANTRALTTPSNPHGNAGNGYTNLEVWLQGYAQTVEGTAAPAPTPVVAPAAPTGLRIVVS